MAAFWMWLMLLMVAWILAINGYAEPVHAMPERIAGAAGFFALFFLSPLFRKQEGRFTALLACAAVMAIAALWPEQEGAVNPYPLLVFTMIAGKAVYRLKAVQSALIGGLLLLGSILPAFFGYSVFHPLFLLVYSVMLGAAFVMYRRLFLKVSDVTLRNEALLSEFRRMKRQLVAGEKLARQEERGQIARDIHDSVGHKLTALLMQLEVFRLEAADGTKERVNELKQLAKESLEETRNAVKTLKEDDMAGLSAIISLIRRLEAESYLRIHMSVKHGAFTAPLSNEQATVVYRAVQEALTNVMKHAKKKEATILFEAPAGTVFRFEVANVTDDEQLSFREGFGLSSMRERVEQAGGHLDIRHYNGSFIVRGTLPLLQKGRDRE
ncbi:sensor histidine kinase [Halalkalibacter oceani]|uniref:sensor histidine kinase n=1 Tax=Halalkalibacter oceani TaxID=1653776 RepID=UPI003399B372